MSAVIRRWLEIVALALRILLWPLRWLIAVLFPINEYDGLSPATTAKAVQNFVSSQIQKQQQLSGGANTAADDTWLTVGFASAKQQAARENALLFVYLHSPLHHKSQGFVRNVLGHDSVVQFLKNPHVRALGVSIHTAQGVQLAQMLQATSYPLVALLQIPPSATTPPSSTARSASSRSSSASSMNLLIRAQGPNLLEWPVDSMVAHLTSCLTRHEVQINEALAARFAREQEAELRRQQDEEYRQALQADQERERQALEADQELERQLETQRQEEEAAKNKLQEAKESIRDAPESGGAMVRFVLPSGTKINRRFYSDDRIGTLKAYLTVHFHEKELQMGKIGLSTSFPRKTYDDNDDETLEQAGLCPQAVLMVQDLDA